MITFTCCGQCATEGHIRPLVPIWHDDHSGHWECLVCGVEAGWWLDGGTVDLGLVTDEQLGRMDVDLP